ncbi:hypothetical protein D3C77_762220 [compost metagenome]
MMVSVAPQVSAFGGTGYISAVSMKLMPAAWARRICSKPSASLFCSPQVMLPSASALTWMSVLPRGR